MAPKTIVPAERSSVVSSPKRMVNFSKQVLQIASTVDDSEDQDSVLTNLIEDEMLGKSRNQNSADVAEFGMLKTADRARARVLHNA